MRSARSSFQAALRGRVPSGEKSTYKLASQRWHKESGADCVSTGRFDGSCRGVSMRNRGTLARIIKGWGRTET
jgi:hypothetical protein